MRFRWKMITFYVASIISGLIAESSFYAQKFELATQLENPNGRIEMFENNTTSLPIKRIFQPRGILQRPNRALNEYLTNNKSVKLNDNINRHSMGQQFNIQYDNVTIDSSKDRRRLNSTKNIDESITTIISTELNDSILLTSSKHLNIERKMDSKEKTTKEISKKFFNDVTTQRLQTTSEGNVHEDMELLMSLKNETYKILSKFEGNISFELSKEKKNISNIGLDHIEEYKQSQINAETDRVLLKQTTVPLTFTSTVQIKKRTKEKPLEAVRIITISDVATTSSPFITTTITFTSTITTTIVTTSTTSAVTTKMLRQTTKRTKEAVQRWTRPRMRPRSLRRPMKTVDRGGLIAGIAITMLLLIGSIFAALFVLFRIKRNQLKQQLQTGTNDNADEAAAISPPLQAPPVPDEPASEWAPDKIKASQFIYKGPLRIPFKQQLILKHDLENEKPPSVHDDQHVQFDDAMNEVHEMGSDVEVVVRGEKEKKGNKDGKGELIGHQRQSFTSNAKKKSNEQIAIRDK